MNWVHKALFALAVIAIALAPVSVFAQVEIAPEPPPLAKVYMPLAKNLWSVDATYARVTINDCLGTGIKGVDISVQFWPSMTDVEGRTDDFGRTTVVGPKSDTALIYTSDGEIIMGTVIDGQVLLAMTYCPEGEAKPY